jgi:hypothetical protein
MRSRRSCRSAPRARADATVLTLVLGDRPVPAATSASDAAWAALRRLLAEALILQDAAEELLLGLRARPDVAEVARPCGRLKGRFAELRDAMPCCGDPEMDRYTAALRQILDHHVLLLKTSLGFLAGEARSERLGERLDTIDGLGAPARRLEAIRAEILRRTSPAACSAAGGPTSADPSV